MLDDTSDGPLVLLELISWTAGLPSAPIWSPYKIYIIGMALLELELFILGWLKKLFCKFYGACWFGWGGWFICIKDGFGLNYWSTLLMCLESKFDMFLEPSCMVVFSTAWALSIVYSILLLLSPVYLLLLFELLEAFWALTKTLLILATSSYCYIS